MDNLENIAEVESKSSKKTSFFASSKGAYTMIAATPFIAIPAGYIIDRYFTTNLFNIISYLSDKPNHMESNLTTLGLSILAASALYSNIGGRLIQKASERYDD